MKFSIVFSFWVLLFAGFFLHAEESINDQVRRLAHELRCPTCQGLSVKESEAGIAVNMKLKIRNLLEEGKSEEEVLQYFVDRYGEWILRNPQKKGFNLLLWGLPGVVTLLAIILFFFSAKKWVVRSEKTRERELSEEDKVQIEKDLEKFNSLQ